MLIETDAASYDIAINVAQIEVTSRCNMNCIHCRGKNSKCSKVVDMPFWAIKKAIDFAVDNSDNNFVEIVLSGGEPLLHPELDKILDYCESLNILKEITTNGSLIDDDFVKKLIKYNITNISVSLDSHIPEKHDLIRNSPGAYNKVINAIKIMKKNNINCRIRATISKLNFEEMEDIVLKAIEIGVDTLVLGPIMPVGNAINSSELLFQNSSEFKEFIDKFYLLKEKYKGIINIITNECLHGIKYLDFNDENQNGIYELNGCTAGITSFNVLINGDVTPCSMFHKKIMNLYESNNLENDYKNSSVIKSLLDRNYSGKCGKCINKYECGGCRVRAEYYTGDCLGEDKMCWI